MVVYSSPAAGIDLLSQPGSKRESWAAGLHVIATASAARIGQVIVVLEGNIQLPSQGPVAAESCSFYMPHYC